MELFEYTRDRVTRKGIVEFSPDDLGYDDFVKTWTRIWKTGVVPEVTEFDLSEAIGLTGWSDATKTSDEQCFRAYRRFTSAVGIALLHFGNGSEAVRPANYLARDLIVDVSSENKSYLGLLRRVFSATRQQLINSTFEEEYPFFTFGEMILAQLDNDFETADRAATELIADESDVRNNEDLNFLIAGENFLLDLTSYNQLHSEWISFAGDLQNPNEHSDTQLVIDELTRQKHNPKYQPRGGQAD